MGLRLNTNVPAITALNHLRQCDRAQRTSVKHLSTGDAITSSADNPSGIVMSEILRAQLGSLEQARENSEFAVNVAATADEALAEVASLLSGIRRSLIFALNGGAVTAEQINAEQNSVDSAVQSIERIASTTRFGANNLLNGSSDLEIGGKSAAITDASVRSVKINGQASRTFDISISAAAERAAVIAQFDPAAGTAQGDHVIKITGSLGTREVFISSGMTTQDLLQQVNNVRNYTGAFAVLASGVLGTPAAADAILLQSDEFGSDRSISLTVVEGAHLHAAAEATGTPALVSDGVAVSDTGADVQGAICGFRLRSDGNRIYVSDNQLNALITLADGTGPTGANPLSFTVQDSGFTFQLNTGLTTHDSITIGIDGISPSTLGMAARTRGGTGAGTGYAEETIGGFLSSVMKGGANDLGADPSNALSILDRAIVDVTDLRSFLGAFGERVIDSNLNSLDMAFESVVSGESEIRDLDYARETARLSRLMVCANAAVKVFGMTNLISMNMLSLLQ